MNITQLLTSWNGLALFAVVFADQAGLPVPCPPWILAAGALVAGGKFNPVLAVGVTALAAILADSLWFYLGRKSGERAMPMVGRWAREHNVSIAHAQTLIARHGLWTLTIAKFLPGTVMPTLAGALGMSVRQFLLCDGLAALFYSGSYITAGFMFHNQIRQVMVWFDRAGHGVIGLVSVLVVGYAAYKYCLWRRTRSGHGRSNNISASKVACTIPRKNEDAYVAK